MKARPILFSAPMVCALLDGRKTQTRRIIKPQPEIDGDDDTAGPSWWLEWIDGEGYTPGELARLCPYGKPGDLLWVREAFGWKGEYETDPSGAFNEEIGRHIVYRSDSGLNNWQLAKGWLPSIHMPRWASRLTLELTKVRVERLQNITTEDAIAEGIEPVLTGDGERCGWLDYEHEGAGTGYYLEAINSYDSLWESINGTGSWDINPWLWVLSFRIHKENVDVLLKQREAA